MFIKQKSFVFNFFNDLSKKMAFKKSRFFLVIILIKNWVQKEILYNGQPDQNFEKVFNKMIYKKDKDLFWYAHLVMKQLLRIYRNSPNNAGCSLT